MTSIVWPLVRYLWALPASLVGLFAAAIALGCGARASLVEGVLEICGGKLSSLMRWLPYSRRFEAITLGHVVIGVDQAGLLRTRAHERVHVTQYERWGVLFFVLYLGSSALAWLRGQDPYRDNHFERDAVAQSSVCGAAQHRFPAVAQPRR